MGQSPCQPHGGLSPPGQGVASREARMGAWPQLTFALCEAGTLTMTKTLPCSPSETSLGVYGSVLNHVNDHNSGDSGGHSTAGVC